MSDGEERDHKHEQYISGLPHPSLDDVVRGTREVAADDHRGGGDERTEHVPHEESAVGHAGVTGDRRDQRPEDADEAAKEDRAAAVAANEVVRVRPPLVADLPSEPRRSHPLTEMPTDLVPERIPEDRTRDGDGDRGGQ